MDKKQSMNEKYSKPFSAYLLLDVVKGNLRVEHCGDLRTMLVAVVSWLDTLKPKTGMTFEELIGAMIEIHNDKEGTK